MSRINGAVLTVVGSLNVDVTASVKRFPLPGESVAAQSVTRRFGGKGANQALAAARQGARVSLIGCVGDDPDARSYLDELRREKITVSTVKTLRNTQTGSALIVVDDQGENSIIVHPGANASLTAATVRTQRARIEVAAAVLLQLEVPLETVVEALSIAAAAKVAAVLNPSPWGEGFPFGKSPIDVVIANETEALAMTGMDVASMEKQSENWVAWIKARKIANLIITRGPQSTLALHGKKFMEIPPHPVKAVDRVGAGDTFAGAFAAHYYGDKSFAEALRRANAAAALSTTKAGAQEGMPFLGDVAVALGD